MGMMSLIFNLSILLNMQSGRGLIQSLPLVESEASLPVGERDTIRGINLEKSGLYIRYVILSFDL